MNYHIQQLNVSIRCYIGTGKDTGVGEHVRFTEHRWRMAVRRKETKLGYSDWVAESVQSEFVDYPVPFAPAPGVPV